MYCKMTNFKHSGISAKLIKILSNNHQIYQEVDGLQNIVYWKISDKEFYSIETYKDKKSHDEKNLIIKNLIEDYISKYLVKLSRIVAGEIVWEHSK